MHVSATSTASRSIHLPVAATPPDAAASPPGWKLGSVVHEGQYCRLFGAWPEGGFVWDQPPYLLKQPLPQLAADPIILAMLRREAEVGMSVSHPHLVPVLTGDHRARPPFLVMPRLGGAPLSTVISATGAFNIPHALWIARQLSEALDALHRARWVHGDVKPANVLIESNGHVTLLDLGACMAADGPRHELDRCWFGTLAYAAPERMSAGAPVSAQSDLYSLGVVLYELITGRLPFVARTPAEWVRAHRDHPAPDPRRWSPDVAEPIAQLLNQMLAKQPLRRPSDAQVVADRLADLELQTINLRFQSRSPKP